VFFIEPFSFNEDEKSESEAATTTLEQKQPEEEKNLCCFNCGSAITSDKQRISIGDCHEHTFVNPGGYVFHIGCFREAPGCLQVGESTTENSWFSGYAWNYALCASCYTHLGWMYHAEGKESFYGLILDRLISF
jgi:hypothetical protein